jgi:hypothetical protein
MFIVGMVEYCGNIANQFDGVFVQALILTFKKQAKIDHECNRQDRYFENVVTVASVPGFMNVRGGRGCVMFER